VFGVVASRAAGAIAMATDGDDEALVEACVAECLESGDVAAALADTCARHPHLADAIRARMTMLRELGLLDEPPTTSDSAGRYTLGARLGGGGMGVVHRAHDGDLERDVALKRMRPELLADSGARERFAREARAVARLRHEGIVTVHAVGDADGAPYLAMELVAGASLERVLTELAGREPARCSGGDLHAAVVAATRASGHAVAESDERPELFDGSWSEACLRVVRRTALALEHAHRAGVLHRDVKPGNVMLTPEGRVVLTDFGLAFAVGHERLTSPGTPVGSLASMAPETLERPDDPPTVALDVYGLGVLAYELLTLRPAFLGATPEATRAAVLASRPDPPRAWNPDLSADAEALVLAALDADPRRRPASAADMAREVLAVLEGRPIRARPSGTLGRARRWARRHPGAAAAWLLGALLLVGVPVAWAVLAERHARDVDAERAVAQAHLDVARRAIDTMLVDVGDELLDAPHLSDLRHRLRLRAVDLYEALASSAAADAGLDTERLDALAQLARLRRQLGQAGDGLTDFARLAAEARAAPGLDDDTRADFLATGLAGQAVAHELAGRLDRATALHREAVDVQRARHAARPQDLDVIYDLAVALSGLAYRIDNAGDVDAAEPLYRESLALLEDSGVEVGERDDFEYALANVRHNLAFALGRAGRLVDAVAETVAALKRMAPFADDSRAWRLTQALNRHELATNLVALGYPDKARPQWTAAIAELEALRDEFPGFAEHWHTLAAACDGLARIERDDAVATALYARGGEALEQATARWPERIELATSLAVNLANRAIRARESGHPAEALDFANRGVAVWDALPLDEPSRPRRLGPLLLVQARAAADLALRDEALEAAWRMGEVSAIGGAWLDAAHVALRCDAHDDAVAMLARAAEAGAFSAADLDDPTWSPLRGSADYAAFAASLTGE